MLKYNKIKGANMENKNDNKIIAIVIGYVTLLFSSFLNFVSMDSETPIITFNFKGYIIVLSLFTFLILAYFIKKKILLIFAYLLTFASYVYSFYLFYKMYYKSVDLHIGAYIFVFSFLIFIVSIFLRKTTKKKELPIEDMVVQENIHINDYIYGTYLYGLPGQKEYSNHPASLINNKNDLILLLTNGKTIKYEIRFDQVESISCITNIALKKNNEETDSYLKEKESLGFAIAQILGISMAEDIKINELGDKVDYTATYLTEINYKHNNDTIKVVLILNRNPDKYFSRFGEKYTRKS